MSVVEEIAKKARVAARELATASTNIKNKALLRMADELIKQKQKIIKINQIDLKEGKKQGISKAIDDRLLLNESRIKDMAQGLKEVAALRDVVGEIVSGWKLPNGLVINKVRVPLGVIGIIYEARPNVTVDAASLCLKSGNAVILRGSSLAINSNKILTEIIASAAEKEGLPKNCIQLIPLSDHKSAQEMMKMYKYIDVLIPRGGEGLIRTVIENSSVPVIETGVGNCHVYVDKDADLKKALAIVINAKVQRPSVCNAAETLLVHKDVAKEFAPKVIKELKKRGVTLYGCKKTQKYDSKINPASEEDWYREYLDLKMAVRIVDSLEEAISHIQKYGTKHSEAIVTKNYESAKKFVEEIDAAALYVNASTRFTDGREFGFGAEIGISTQKLHARGPMALPELTTFKYIVYGTGQIRE